MKFITLKTWKKVQEDHANYLSTDCFVDPLLGLLHLLRDNFLYVFVSRSIYIVRDPRTFC